MNKVSKYLILGLAIVVILLLIYIAYPKYDFYVKDDTVYRLNKITGKVTKEYSPALQSKFETSAIDKLLQDSYIPSKTEKKSKETIKLSEIEIDP